MEPDVQARLAGTFDPARLSEALRDLEARASWVRHPGRYHDGAWRAIALHGRGGSVARVDAGGLGSRGFAPTPHLGRAPVFAELLERLPGRKRAVRLMSLAPGAVVRRHVDPELNLCTRNVRIHVPIRTHPDVVLDIDGVRCRWTAGSVWYGDFTRPHEVRNESPIDRVHLVIDLRLDPALEAWFPAGYLPALRRRHARALPASQRVLWSLRARL